MRKSIIFERTLRAVFSGTDLVSHGLLLRAGFVRQLAAGLFSYLPLAKRSPDKISILLLEEMKAYGGQKLSVPVVHPADVWERLGRYRATGPEPFQLGDHQGGAWS